MLQEILLWLCNKQANLEISLKIYQHRPLSFLNPSKCRVPDLLLTVYVPGISAAEMRQKYTSEVVYNSELDSYFPFLSVVQTLEFAATLRTNRNRVKYTGIL
jgi:hypothetical protein